VGDVVVAPNVILPELVNEGKEPVAPVSPFDPSVIIDV
jgi:hypothetical protein